MAGTLTDFMFKFYKGSADRIPLSEKIYILQHDVESLIAAGTIEFGITTGANTSTKFLGFLLNAEADDIRGELREDVTFTGGTAPKVNMIATDRVENVAADTTVVVGITLTDAGLLLGDRRMVTGDTSGKSTLGLDSNGTTTVLLKPNSKYLIRITNLDTFVGAVGLTAYFSES